MDKAVIIGYSGHAYVVIDILTALGYTLVGYYDKEKKGQNPYHLKYLGEETTSDIGEQLKNVMYFIGIGNNLIRKKIDQSLYHLLGPSINAIHPQSIISPNAQIASSGVMIAPNAVVNACASIGKGCICNTSCIIEHECHIEEFCHIAPGATLCGNVKVGTTSFIGAQAVIKQGIRIGKNVTIGAGTVVLNDVPDNTVVVGNPQRFL